MADFTRATDLDPGYAPAIAGRDDTYRTMEVKSCGMPARLGSLATRSGFFLGALAG